MFVIVIELELGRIYLYVYRCNNDEDYSPRLLGECGVDVCDCD